MFAALSGARNCLWRRAPALVFLLAVTGSSSADAPPMIPNRDVLLETLRQSFASETGMIRIHAAEALVEHGEGPAVAAELRKGADDPPPIVRVGIWRTLARTAAPDEQSEYVERLRRVMLTAGEPDRIHAAESLAKLGISLPGDWEAIDELANNASAAGSCHPIWLLALSGDSAAESRLAGRLDSSDEIARLVAAYIIGRLPAVARSTEQHLIDAAGKEPAASPARGYLLAAVVTRTKDPATAARFKSQLIERLSNGTAAEKYEGALALGSIGTRQDLMHLSPLLQEPGDPRIGAAQGGLRILSRAELPAARSSGWFVAFWPLIVGGLVAVLSLSAAWKQCRAT